MSDLIERLGKLAIALREQHTSSDAQIVVDAIDALSHSPRWILVSERLPEQDDHCYLIYCPGNRCIYTAYQADGHWFYFSGGGNHQLERDVTHWMPLPEAPK